tara:strand:- start:10301 stop:12562 length:2262 start_codon:yes stop_codon:yes gene_type:complete
MAGETTELKVVFKTEGLQNLRGLSSALSQMGKGAKKAGIDVKGLMRELKAKERTELKSINNTRALSNGYRELARQVDVSSREFREATREANRLDRSLMKMQRTASRGMGGRLRGAAKTAGAIGAAGIFGGVEGFAGAAVGGLFGGVQGAVVGGTAGAALGGARQSLGEIAKYNAQLRQQQFALKLVIKDTDKYNNAQKFLAETSESLAIPQDVIVRQFTSLTASVVGAGKSVEDAQDVFLSIASGIRGTGGSLEDMRSAMVATAQVFSKGKVSAEELRQQLGERLPGAFTLFAASMGKTPAELDKALEQGKVTLDDFMGFSKHLFKNYGENAKILADSPAAAGDRLNTEFGKLKKNFGGLFANIGANIQDFATKLLKSLNNNQVNVKKFIANFANFFIGGFNVVKKVSVDVFEAVKGFAVGFAKVISNVFKSLENFINGSINAINGTINKIKNIPLVGKLFKDVQNIESFDLGSTLTDGLKNVGTFLIGGDDVVDNISKYKNQLKEIFDNTEKLTVEQLFEDPEEFTKLLNSVTEGMNNISDATSNLKTKGSEAFANLKTGMQSYLDSISDVNKQIQDATVNAFKKMEDALVNFVMTGKLNFKDFARSLIADITRIYVRQSLITPLLGAFGLSPTPASTSAKGNIFNKDGLMKFAKGGIITEPTYFKYGGAGKLGLMGEAGSPEAIMPLKRTSSGNLGVEATGGGSTNVVVNVDASGSSVEGDDQSAKQLGQIIAAAVQSEIVNQQMSGGLLS